MAPRTAAHMKAMGMLAGVADLEIIVKGRVYYLELKSAKGRQSEAQREFENCAGLAGAIYFLTNNINEALIYLEAIGAIKGGA